MPMSLAEAARRKPTPTFVSLVAFLDRAPADKVFTTAEILGLVGIGSTNTLQLTFRKFGLNHYRTHPGKGRQVYWGNPKAIVALKKALAEG